MHTAEVAALADKSLADHVRDVLAAGSGPLDLAGVKKAMKAAGVLVTKKQKVTDEDIRHGLEEEVRHGRVFEHPPRKAGGKTRYATFRALTAEEIAEKKRAEKEAAAEKKRAEKAAKQEAERTAAVAKVRADVAAAVAALGDELVGEGDLGKPKGEVSKAVAAEFTRLLQDLLDSGRLHQHGKKYAKHRPKSAGEIAAEKEAAAVAEMRRNVQDRVAAIGDSPVPESALGKPPAKAGGTVIAAFKEILSELLAEKKLYKHGAKYGKRPPVVPKWFERSPFKRPFESLVKAAATLLSIEGVDPDQMWAELRSRVEGRREAVASGDSAPAPSPTPRADEKTAEQSPAELRDSIRTAYNHLCLFDEFRDRLVEIPRLFHATRNRVPDLAVADFHRELLALSRGHVIELRELNEVRGATERELAIDRDGRLLYYVFWG